MSRFVTATCDRCGKAKKFAQNREQSEIQPFGVKVLTDTEPKDTFLWVDLCDQCRPGFAENLRKLFSTET